MMTTNEIADIIISSMCERSFSVFGTTIQGAGLDEADVLGINRNDYIYEYEIKRSRADYRADFKKDYKHRKLKEKESTRTYAEWKNGKKTGGTVTYIVIPNRFYYVCVKDLIKKDEIPEYAGLIYVEDRGSFKEIKKAPLLHKVKANINTYRRIASILSQRMVYGCSYYTHLQKKNKEKNEILLNNKN